MTITPSQALGAYLDSIPDYLRSPIFPELEEAAKQLQNAEQADVLQALLGAAGSYGCDLPTLPLSFPADHALHMRMGSEWYWLGANLEVDGSGGLDKIGVLVLMTRNRSVSNGVQASFGWNELQAQIVDTSANITVATRDACFMARRTLNTQWPAMGGNVEISAPGESFVFACGTDSFRGGVDVLPLAIQIHDGPNLTIDLKATSDLAAQSAFFLQGLNGLTAEPRPGLYYSWPQVSIQGTVSAGGKSYSVHGKGWIDHQLMMGNTNPPPPPVPPPSRGFAPVTPCDGWSWCEFNLDNGDAITVAGFQAGILRTDVPVPYGFYVRATPGGWQAIPLQGTLALDRFVPGIYGVLTPSAWTYQLVDAQTGGSLVDVEVLPVPWYPDGSFASSNLSVYGETAVSVAMIDHAPLNAQTGPGTVATGSGYCESVGYEPTDSYVRRALASLIQAAPSSSASE